MSFRNYLKQLFPIFPALLFGTLSQAEKPNIIHILADDLGWRDLAVYGSETFDTPHLDRLAEKGMVFSQGYAASPLCSPTRAATLTGQTVSRIRITSPTGHLPQVILDPEVALTNSPGMPATNPGNRSRLPLDVVTYAQILKDAGYATAHLGKWHLGNAPYIPENFGFDFVVGGRGTPGPPQSRFFGPWNPEADNVPAPLDRPNPDAVRPNIDDVLGDYAVRFIEENSDGPFLINLWLYNPHAPFEGVPEDIEAARQQAELGIYQQSAIMSSMVKTIDENVGKVMEALEREGLWENTIVIFTSDNGGNMYDRPEGVNPTNNHPLRAGKGNNYEGGSRVPLIVAWPGVVAGGSYSDAVSISYDWFPTFLELAGLSAPEGWTLDGQSLMPALRGEPFERGPIFSSFPHTVFATGNFANVWVRDGNWKLLRFFNVGPDQEDEFELYDLSRDVGEQLNRLHEYPHVAARLKPILARQLEDEEALLPLKNPLFDADFRQAGFRMIDGALLVGGPTEIQARFTARSHRVTLRYDLGTRGVPGDTLAFSVVSNSARSVTVGVGETPVFGPPVRLVPNLVSQDVRVPLGRSVESGEIMVIFDLEQPGRTDINNPRMIDGARERTILPVLVDGVPEFSFEGGIENHLGDWFPSNDIAAAEVVDGRLVATSEGNDPYLVMSRKHFMAEQVAEVVVRMKSDKAGYAELFWTFGNQNFDQAYSVQADFAGRGDWETLRFPVAGLPGWDNQRITRLRIDPINRADTTFEIESITALPRR
jgi:arylsulfatase A-like enzyme